MKLLTSTMKMADVVNSNYLLIPVINRFGIRLGFGEKTVETVCREHSIDAAFFLAIVNAFNNEHFFPQQELQTFNVVTILGYLKKTHAYYIETQIPLIEGHLSRLFRGDQGHNRDFETVLNFFLEYKKQLLTHLRREETVTFPYIERIYALSTSGNPIPAGAGAEYSMQVYEHEHDNVDEKLTDLKNILIKYIRGDFDETVCHTIIFELFRLEKDIQDHTRIEETILRPIVTAMERKLSLQSA